MKKTIAILCLAALIASIGIPSAHAVQGRPSVITFDDPGAVRKIYAFVKGDNGHLYSNHFNGTTWTWNDHGLPEGATAVSYPRAVTYYDANGNRRIYVFVVDNTGHLAIRFFRGPAYGWQWSKQGGPTIMARSLSASTYLDDSGVMHLYAFAFSPNPGGAAPFKLVKHYWNGSAWGWNDMDTVAGLPYDNVSFTETTNYKGNDGRNRLDVFCAAGNDQVLLRHSLVDQAWSATNLGGRVDLVNASSVNFVDTPGYRRVETYVRHLHETIWRRAATGWTDFGKPPGVSSSEQGLISATAFNSSVGFPNVKVFVEWEKRLYVRAWNNDTWQPWVDLGRPSSIVSPTDGVRNTSAITWRDATTTVHHTMVFMTGVQNGNLYLNWWNGSSWQWYNRGNP